MKKYNVIIVGAGPSGIFTALELVKRDKIDVLILDKGRSLNDRLHSIRASALDNRSVSSRLFGWGGAGAFSDGKLNLSPEVGGFLDGYLNDRSLIELIKYVDKSYLDHGATTKVYGADNETLSKIKGDAARYNLKLIETKIRHMGTDKCPGVLENFRETLKEKVEIKFDVSVSEVIVKDSKVKGVKTKGDKRYYADCVVLAPGRGGAEWLDKQSKKLGINSHINPVDIGVRVEVPAVTLSHITDIIYEPKLLYRSKYFDDKIRTFCMNPYGEVIAEVTDGIYTVNGHSYSEKKSDNTNFALLVSTSFTKPFNEPVSYGKYIARLANFLGDGVIVQRLGDLLKGRRSTDDRIKKGIVVPTLKDATPGDLSFVLPYRYLVDILEMLESLDRFAPGINSGHTLLYGVEVKFYSLQPYLSKSLETEITNLFTVGDGAGVSRGLVQASVSGVIAAREILKRITN